MVQVIHQQHSVSQSRNRVIESQRTFAGTQELTAEERILTQHRVSDHPTKQ